MGSHLHRLLAVTVKLGIELLPQITFRSKNSGDLIPFLCVQLRICLGHAHVFFLNFLVLYPSCPGNVCLMISCAGIWLIYIWGLISLRLPLTSSSEDLFAVPEGHVLRSGPWWCMLLLQESSSQHQFNVISSQVFWFLSGKKNTKLRLKFRSGTQSKSFSFTHPLFMDFYLFCFPSCVGFAPLQLC